MKKVLLRSVQLLLVSLITSNVIAQTVSYTYKPLAAEGCAVKYSVARQDTSYYIITTVSSDRMYFLGEPTMKVRTFDDKIFTLDGIVIDNNSESAGIILGNILVPATEIRTTAQFKVNSDQFESIKNGIAKIRLSMTPMNHERTFKKDKIGKKLYQLYLKTKLQNDNF